MEKQIKRLNQIQLIATNLIKYAEVLVNKQYNRSNLMGNEMAWKIHKLYDLIELRKSLVLTRHRIDDFRHNGIDYHRLESSVSLLITCIDSIDIEIDKIEDFLDIYGILKDVLMRKIDCDKISFFQ